MFGGDRPILTGKTCEALPILQAPDWETASFMIVLAAVQSTAPGVGRDGQVGGGLGGCVHAIVSWLRRCCCYSRANVVRCGRESVTSSYLSSEDAQIRMPDLPCGGRATAIERTRRHMEANGRWHD